ncbi:hypothetical protein [Paraburkholderia sp.]|uniref:hypothetical protein n=1 Tax=Paraburkholderia sp. TaxID=1926495 RepID=UPI0039E59364
MAKVGYFNKEGDAIPLSQWRELQADRSYSVLKEYDNGSVNVTLRWHGRVPDPTNSWRESWPMFVLNVSNYDSAGVARPDPVADNKTFYEQDDALRYYTNFIAKWTESRMEKNEMTGEMELIEEGNILVPEAPPDPNRPATEVDDDIGAW